MKKFVFTLESLKRYQDQVLETEKGKLSELRGELNRLEAELEDILAELERLNRELVVMYEKGTTPLEISVHKRYISAKQQELHMKKPYRLFLMCLGSSKLSLEDHLKVPSSPE